MSSRPVLAWGSAGHRIVAMIAEARLSSGVRDQVREILIDGKYSLADISTCADTIRDSGRREHTTEEETCRMLAGAVTQNTAPWHYIDIPVPRFETPLARYCPDSNCVVAALEKFRDLLRNSGDDGQRRSALLFVVHFLGDLHQPLHCAERACDRGGNLERVNFFMSGRESPGESLHKVWDTDLVGKAMADAHATDERAYAAQLAAKIGPAKAQRWAQASIDDIAWESHAIAAKRVYRGIPFQNFCDDQAPFHVVDLSAKYERAGVQIVREQLMKAGVRLAALLEFALGRDGPSETRIN